jgi:ribokinase
VRAGGGRSLLNFAPASAIGLDLLRDVDFVIANEGEAAALGKEPASIASRLRQGVVITRGAAGAVAYLADGSVFAVPALPVVPVDTTGAGDTFVGVLAAALDGNAPIETALRRASAAAGLACLARGAQTAMPDAAAIDAATARLPPS